MKYRIDFHCHSVASDGGLTIPELADLAYKTGLDALVVTDHCSPFCSYHQNVSVLSTLKAIGHSLKVPVILGAEIGTPYGEFLLFGSKAIKNWYCYKNKLKMVRDEFTMEIYWEMFWLNVLHGDGKSCWGGGIDKDGKAYNNREIGCELPYAMIMPHPTASAEFIERCPQRMFDCIHGFEVNNSGIDFEANHQETFEALRKRIKHPRELKNSDCHMKELGIVSNEVELPDNKPLSEGALIKWLRNKK